MRLQLLVAFASVVVLVSQVHCACDRAADAKESEDGDVTKFFKNLGCDIKKGADKVSESTRPWIKDFGASAKRFGGTVSDTFTDLKNKITGSPTNGTTPEALSTTAASTAATTAATTQKGDSSSLSPVKVSIEDRILLETPPRCQEGERLDAQNNCRKF